MGTNLLFRQKDHAYGVGLNGCYDLNNCGVNFCYGSLSKRFTDYISVGAVVND